MTHPRLAVFIRDNMEPILQAWEDFARTIEPPALTMTDDDLRDHARQMLLVFADDLDTEQSDVESAAKSIGHGKRGKGDTAAEIHAEARLLSGYTVVQLVSEYRALRASVLALWAARMGDYPGTAMVMVDMMRFNEAVDQTLAESVARYQSLVKQSQNMFLAILGHDLRNPLGTLVSGSSIIMQGADVPPKYVLVAKRMFDSAKRMSRLINDLIDFTRTHLGPGIPIRAGEGDLTALCTQVANELRIAHPQRHIALHAPHRLEAVFDEGRIAQMLSNLIGNALQYGSEDAPVTIDITESGGEVSIVINNRGPVIPPDKLVSIFDPMVRIAASACNEDEDTERTGLGIGLFISREIALAHGGQVGVVSNAADGTTFTVTMPRWPGGTRPADTPAGTS